MRPIILLNSSEFCSNFVEISQSDFLKIVKFKNVDFLMEPFFTVYSIE